MKRFAFVALLCLAVSAPAFAADSPPAPEVAALAAAPVAPHVVAPAPVAAPQVVYLAMPAAAPTAAPAPAPSGFVAMLGAVPIDTWALILGVIVMVVLRILGTKGDKARELIDQYADIAYSLAEAAARNSPGGLADKGRIALDAFHRGLMGQGINPTPADVAHVQAVWAARASDDHTAEEIHAAAIKSAQAKVEAIPGNASAFLGQAMAPVPELK